jgi:hypothetical protein
MRESQSVVMGLLVAVSAVVLACGGGGGPTTYALTVISAGTGNGTVSSSTGGISCGSTCSAMLASSTTVTLTATPSAGSVFSGWTGSACTGTGTCVVTLTANQTVGATFDLGPTTSYTLTVVKSGTGIGTVTGGTIICGTACGATVASGTDITLTATADSGSAFACWSGCDGGSGASCIVTMTADRTVTATFAPTSGLPAPPGPVVSRPSGAPGNLRVLDWAGFRSASSYSFDDSNQSQVDHYTELNAMGVRMSFYAICSKLSTSRAAWQRASRDGHEIANHTMHHSSSSVADPLAELDDCTNILVQQYGVSGVWTMAAPNGDPGWGPYAQQRFLLNRGTTNGTIAPNDSTDPFNLPAYIPPANSVASAFNAVTDTAHTNGSWVITVVHGFTGGTDSAYQPVSITEFITSVQYAKGLGDVWLDSVVNVGAYWRAQKMMSSVSPVISGTTQTWTWTLPPQFPPGKFLRVKVDGGTLQQGDTVLPWDPHGYYEVALDAGSLSLTH